MNKKHHRMPLLLLAAVLAVSLCALGAVAISASAVSNTAFPTASRQNMNICLKQASAKPSGQAAQPTGTPDTSPVPSSDPALQDPSQNGNPDGQPVRTPPCGCLQPCSAAQRNPECQLCAQDPAACQAGQVHIVLTGAYPAASSYTVTFDLNGHGGNAPANQVVEAGGHVAEPAAPTDADHNFYGWYRDADCTAKWDFAQDAVTAGLTLYAKWERAAIPAQILGESQHVTQPYGTKGGSISLEGLDIPAGHGGSFSGIETTGKPPAGQPWWPRSRRERSPIRSRQICPLAHIITTAPSPQPGRITGNMPAPIAIISL